MTNHVRNILKLYRQATQEDTVNGVEWYARAERMAKAIAVDSDLPLPTVIGVMAALSPNNRWERNCRDAATMCQAWQNGEGMDSFKVSCYNTMKAKAWVILDLGLTDDEDILSHLNGQKIRSFYSNIRGLEEVTIDGHALNIARGKREGLTSDKTNMGKREYRELQNAYVRAAKRVRVKPHVLQAITWTTWKRVHSI